MFSLRTPFLPLTILALLASGSYLQADPNTDAIPWMHDIETAVRIAAESQKLVLVHFWTPDCLPCRRLESTTFNQPEFAAALTDHYIPVKINARQDPEIAQRFGVNRWPTDVILMPSGQMAYRTVSPQVASHYVHLLNDLALRTNPSAGRPASPMPWASQSGQPPNLDAQIAITTRRTTKSPTTFSPPQASPGSQGSLAAYAARPPLGLPRAIPQSIPQPIPFSTGAAYVQPALNAASDGDLYNQVRQASHDTPPRRPEKPADIINHYVTQPNQQLAAPPLTDHATGRRDAETPTPPPAPQPATQSALPSAPQPATQPALPPAPVPAPQLAPQLAPPPAPQLPPRATPPRATVESASPATSGGDQPGPQPASPTTSFAGPPLPEPPSPAPPSPAPAAAPSLGNPASSPGSPLVSARAAPPAMGLDGYCPVTLLQNAKWVPGDRRWGVRHRGRVYLFHSAAAQQQFLADPDRFSPAISGYDPVRFADENRYVAGQRRHGVVYQERIFLFESEDSLMTFQEHPQRYTESVQQAMRMADLMR